MRQLEGQLLINALAGHMENIGANVGPLRIGSGEEENRFGQILAIAPGNPVSAQLIRTERNIKTGWRRGWDSNPRDPFGPNGFQDRRSQPLSYPSCNLSLLTTALGSNRQELDFASD